VDGAEGVVTKARVIHLPGDPVALDGRHRPIFATERWGVLLYRNQTNLGRSLVYLRTRPLDDPLALAPDEHDELWTTVLPALTFALDAAFAPDRVNLAHLANRLHHVHWHVVPRYEVEPERWFAEQRFVDTRPGRSFRVAKRGRVKPRVRELIAEHIRAQLPGEMRSIALPDRRRVEA
jgi:diadenosine tetraphosphate (Ap4A) HIT family hydrolase